MKRLRFLLVALVLSTACAYAQTSDFPGVQKAMSPEAFEQAGLSKLSPEERARLDEFIRGYAAATSEKAATAAVDEAAKSGKVKRNEPEVIQSSIVGTFRGYDGRTTFRLENGTVWKQTQQVSRTYPPID